jgi:hypothetical protein
MAPTSEATRKIQVVFPAVAPDGRGSLVQIDCWAHLDQRGNPQAPDRRFEDVIRRYRGVEGVSDAKAPFTFLDTSPRIGSEFDLVGESFQLAVVLADRLARYGGSENRSIIATGRLPASDGGVSTVGQADFDKKLDLLLEAAPAGSLFIFPRANAANNCARSFPNRVSPATFGDSLLSLTRGRCVPRST